MLQSLRSTAASWFVKALFVVLIVSFAAWGIGDFTGRTKSRIASVGGTEITQAEIDQQFRSEISRLRQVLGPEFSTEQARQLGVLDRSLDQLVQRALLTHAAQRLGLVAGDASVAEAARGIRAFQNAAGTFDPQIMRAVLRENGLSEAQFVEQVRADLARQLLLQSISGGVTAPATLAEALFRFRGERRIATVVDVPVSAVPPPPAPDEATLVAYHKEHAVKYTAPEYRTLTVATLTADAAAADVTVSEDELRRAYDERAGDFIRPETRDLLQVVLEDKLAADKMAAAVNGGTPLATAATQAGKEAVPLDGVRKEDLPAELAGPVFALAAGATGGPFQSPLGWHVVTAVKVTQGGETSFDVARPRLMETLKREKAVDRLFQLSNQMDDKIASGVPLREVAATFGAKLKRLETVDTTGVRPDGTRVEETPDLARVLQVGFGLGEGAVSNMTELDPSTFFAVALEELRPAALKPLADVRAVVQADWVSERRGEAAKAKAEEMATAIRSGQDPAKVAATLAGTRVRTTDPLLRNPGPDGSLPRALLSQLFTLSDNGVAVGESAEGVSIVRLDRIVPADPVSGGPQIAQIRQTAAGTLADDLVTEYLTHLRRETEVTVNRTALDALYRRER